MYIEKEGYVEILRSVGWPERHDCALLTAKGFSTRAVRDLIDKLADSEDEPLTVFCLHDADGPGTVIYESLQEETAARPKRTVEIVNIGLDPWEAVKMGLPLEPVLRKGDRAVPCASYVPEKWVSWLQRYRGEFNAMKPRGVVAFLDEKLKEHDGKVIPPQWVLVARLQHQVKMETEQIIRERILQKSGFSAQVDQALEEVAVSVGKAERGLRKTVESALRAEQRLPWNDVVNRVAAGLARRTGKRSRRAAKASYHAEGDRAATDGSESAP